MSEIERSVLLLASGDKGNSVQRISVLINLPSILRDFPEAQETLLTKIFNDVLSWDEELQVEGGASLAVIIEEDILNKEMKEKFHYFILEALESWNKARWDVVGEHYIQHLDKFQTDEAEKSKIINNFVDLGLSLGELSQAIPSRGTGARLMAILSNMIDKETAVSKLLPRLKNLCRDFNWEVRKSITSHISHIFQLLEKTECDDELFDIMTELLDDEENEVKNLAIEAFFENMNKFTDAKIEESGIEIMVDLIKSDTNAEFIIDGIEKAITNGETLRRHFGSLEYMQHENEELRNRILYNSHLLLKTLGEEYFVENILEYYSALVKHEDEAIREKIAESAHEVVKQLNTVGGFKNGFHKLITSFMTDKSVNVQGAILVYLDEIVKVLVPSEITEEFEENEITKKLTNFKTTFGKNFMNMEENVKKNWRHLVRWIDCQYKLLNLFDSIVIVKGIPNLVTHLKKGGKETRNFGIQFLGRLISGHSNPIYKREVGDLSADLPYNTGSFVRSIYLEFLEELTDHVSKKTFGSIFLDAYYLLSKDKGSNVIIKFCSVTPKIYKKVSFEDSKNKERIVNIIKGLIESDKVKPYIKEFAEKSYEKILSFGTLNTVQKSIREEEEKKLIEHEKMNGDKDKFDFNNRRMPSNGFKMSGRTFNLHKILF